MTPLSMASVDYLTTLEQDMSTHGLSCPDTLIPDGRIHRFKVLGDKPGSKAGWYVLFEDTNPTCVFSSWKRDEQHTWSLKGPHELSPLERQHHQQRVSQAQQESERERQILQKEAAIRAQDIWENSLPAPEDHPYLIRKQIQPHGTRFSRGKLIIPVYDELGAIVTLQFIREDGSKRFLSNGAKTGNDFTIGEPGNTLYVVEGFATGVTVHEVTGAYTVVAFDTGNLKPVALRLRREHPDAQIILAADNDRETEGNPGLTKATEAAQAVDGSVVFPTFQNSEASETMLSDFNDLMNIEGVEIVRAQLSVGQTSASWPILDPGALYGLPGELVQTLLPETEADAVTLLVHLLSEYSCLVGQGPYIRLDGDVVPLSFWPVVVGDSSKSRKGSGSKRIKRLFKLADPLWTRGIHSGSLSSGEGLIYAVRDEERGWNSKGEEVIKDEGILDKRLYLVQTEFGSMLRIMAREGNSLSGHLRDAWDGETLKPMTKGFRIQATYPQIVVVGHVTRTELLCNLKTTEMANGFGNRFCWFLVKRSKCLPFADNPSDTRMEELAKKLHEAIEFASTVQEVSMSDEAKTWWVRVYEELSQPTPGLVGSLLDRGEAQVRRIAALYALLDMQSIVGVKHLYAALALWNYSTASVKYIFENCLGDHVADSILSAIRKSEQGLSDTDISGLFNRHEGAARLAQAKAQLQAQGLIESKALITGGRPLVVWVAKKAKEAKKGGG